MTPGAARQRDGARGAVWPALGKLGTKPGAGTTRRATNQNSGLDEKPLCLRGSCGKAQAQVQMQLWVLSVPRTPPGLPGARGAGGAQPHPPLRRPAAGADGAWRPRGGAPSPSLRSPCSASFPDPRAAGWWLPCCVQVSSTCPNLIGVDCCLENFQRGGMLERAQNSRTERSELGARHQ